MRTPLHAVQASEAGTAEADYAHDATATHQALPQSTADSLLDDAEPQGKMGSVTALAAVKSLVVASEFLGSITVSRVQPNSLVPLQVRSVDRSGLFAQATLPLSDTDFLVAAHPFGLVLLKRCVLVCSASLRGILRLARSQFA